MAANTMNEVLAALANHQDKLRRLGVRRLRLFGSLARGVRRPESDLDFLVSLESKTFDRYMDLKFFLEDLLGRKVDLVIEGTIKPMLRETIEREAVDVGVDAEIVWDIIQSKLDALEMGVKGILGSTET